ncbi:MAG: T9SS type A sorting domain-containing protein [Cytophagales bacterium]
MKFKSLHLSTLLFFSILSSFAQVSEPLFYPKIVLYGNPIAAKEYSYDPDTQEESLNYNHNFKYNTDGQLTEHLMSDKLISPHFYQNIRYRFSYDNQKRLVYFWNEIEGINDYKSDWEHQWVYDTQGMIVEDNQWAIDNTTKNLGYNSFKRVVTRNANNQVLKIERRNYEGYSDTLVLEKSEEYVYKDNKIDTIIFRERNVTLGGIMQVVQKRFDIKFLTYNDKNTDLIQYKSYNASDRNDYVFSMDFTYDSLGRITSETEKFLSYISVNSWTYEPNKTTYIEKDYTKNVKTFDESGEITIEEKFTKSGGVWESDGIPYIKNTRTFSGKNILTDLEEQYVFLDSKYIKTKKYVFENAAVGVTDEQILHQDLVYPNPSEGFIHINGIENIVSMNLTSSNGITEQLPLATTISLEQPDGLYLLTIHYKNGTSKRMKLVVQ